MTKDRIGKLRELSDRVFHGDTKPGDFRIIDRAADALSTRQPTEDDREAIAKALCEGADTCWNDLTEQELVWHYRDAESVLAAGFSRATEPDAATERGRQVEAELRDMLRVDIPSLKAERDAALAAIERVRAIHGPSDEFPAGCDYCERLTPCSTRAALDGAPELDPYDDFCPTCDAPNPGHTETCEVPFRYPVAALGGAPEREVKP